MPRPYTALPQKLNHYTMNIQDINELSNDVAVQRLLIKQYEEDIEKIKEYQELLMKIEEAKRIKSEAQDKLIEAMKSEGLKSWKTTQASFSIGTRYSVSTDPIYKKEIEHRLKEGEVIDGYELKKTEYLSIRTT